MSGDTGGRVTRRLGRWVRQRRRHLEDVAAWGLAVLFAAAALCLLAAATYLGLMPA